MFAKRADAEAGLAVFKEHSTVCYIGRGNTLPNRSDYVSGRSAGPRQARSGEF